MLEFGDLSEAINRFSDVLFLERFLELFSDFPRTLQIGFLDFLFEVRAGFRLGHLLEVHVFLDLGDRFFKYEFLVAKTMTNAARLNQVDHETFQGHLLRVLLALAKSYCDEVVDVPMPVEIEFQS